jgi:hypothetical protein
VSRRFVRIAAASALALVASLPANPALAGVSMTITVTPVDPKPGDNITVDGDVSSGCPLPNSYEITLTYPTPDSPPDATHVETGVVNVDGTFSDTFAIPEDAVADNEAFVSARAVCNGVTHTSTTVTLNITAHQGDFTLTPDEVEAGGTVTASGTNCYGEFIVFYVEAGASPNDEDNIIDGADGTPLPNRTWSVEFETPPDLPAGDYDFYAACSGTNYEPQVLAVTAASGPTPTPTPTATPPVAVPGGVDFTG